MQFKANHITSKNKEELQRNQDGTLIMSQKNIQILCRRQNLYEYPEMNIKLYLHFKVIAKIQGLSSYKNLKTLYLENNVIKVIENLHFLPYLENLFLQNNMIRSIQNLDSNRQLKVLNLSHNNILELSGLSNLVQLQTFTISNNYLKVIDDLYHLGQCSANLTSIDLSNNQIQPSQILLNLIPQVKCLYLYGNPLVRQTNHYRRRIIGTLKNLLYLDQRTIDFEERTLSEAFVKDGQNGVKEAKKIILAQRQATKIQQKKKLLENIDFHRANKIRIFQRNIKQFQKEIKQLQQYMEDKENQDMYYFYQTRINQLDIKIKQTEQFIINNKKIINKSQSSIIKQCDLKQQDNINNQILLPNRDNLQQNQQNKNISNLFQNKLKLINLNMNSSNSQNNINDNKNSQQPCIYKDSQKQ